MNKREKATMQIYNKMLRHPENFYLDPAYSLERFADDLKLNRTYASRFANNTLGMPFRDLLQKLRIQHAVELMKCKDLKLNEIARASGFAADISFRRAYLKICGKNPSIGRKEVE